MAVKVLLRVLVTLIISVGFPLLEDHQEISFALVGVA